MIHVAHTSINLPQAAVLGMHSIKEKPVVVNGEIVIRPIMVVALTYDHRLLDGREAVTFLGTLTTVYLDMYSRQSASRSTSRTPAACSSPRPCKLFMHVLALWHYCIEDVEYLCKSYHRVAQPENFASGGMLLLHHRPSFLAGWQTQK